MTNKKHYSIDLQYKVFEQLKQADAFLVDGFAKDKLVHLSKQPSYLHVTESEHDFPLARFLRYKTGPQQIDNDVSMASWALYLRMHPFLDKDTLRKQDWHDKKTWTRIVYDQKFLCTSLPARVLGNKRTSLANFIGDTCTSPWTPWKTHVNRNLAAGLEAGDVESQELAEFLGADKIKSVNQVKAVMDRKDVDVERFMVLLAAHMLNTAMMFIDMSDTVGNVMLCPEGCNATRAGNGAACDTIQYYLVHVYKYFETGDVRFLNRLFAGHYAGGHLRYTNYESLDDVPSEANKYAQEFMSMLERAGVRNWESYLDAFCMRAFCVEDKSAANDDWIEDDWSDEWDGVGGNGDWNDDAAGDSWRDEWDGDWDDDAETSGTTRRAVHYVPMDFRTGRAFEWDGEAHYDVTCCCIEEDARMFVNLAGAIIKRNAELSEMVAAEKGRCCE